MTKKIKIVHLINDLIPGGAENALLNLVSHLAPQRFSCRVISLGGNGEVGSALAELGFPVTCLGLKRGVQPSRWFQLIKLLKNDPPDILQTWMYHADLTGSICGRLAGLPHIIWNIRNFNIEKKYLKTSTRLVIKICSRLSFTVPQKIITCSENARQNHIQAGYQKEKFLIIPNGFDAQVFRPDPAARSSIRSELGVQQQDELVGLIGRFDPIKDHANFFAAANLLHCQRPQVHFVLCGAGVIPDNPQIVAWVRQYGLAKNTHLLGARRDVARIQAALDVAVSSSAGEAFPNVIGEAMSCGVPCVVTNVGDSAFLVGDTGRVVEPHHPSALADAIAELLALPVDKKQRLGNKARQRILGNFEINNITKRYEKIYLSVMDAGER